jgi:cyclopropane fatty-acyl-phospholipid synthase-like methyltransferase
MRWLEKMLSLLDEGSRVLDVGCGNGLPATSAIAEHHRATGIDVSGGQIARARENVPGAELHHVDVMEAKFGERFDAISAFYVVEHLPRQLHATVFERFNEWLRPGGYLLFTIEPDAEPGVVGDWLGAPMFFSQHDAAETLSLVQDAGFRIVSEAVEDQLEGGREISYLWVLAQKPQPAS